MVKIYHVPGTRSIRAIWACEELGVPYEAVPVDFTPEFRNSPEWRAISPTGKVPAMEDGDLVMFESGAMVQYVLDRYGEGRLAPAKDSPEQALEKSWKLLVKGHGPATDARKRVGATGHDDYVAFVYDGSAVRRKLVV